MLVRVAVRHEGTLVRLGPPVETTATENIRLDHGVEIAADAAGAASACRRWRRD